MPWNENGRGNLREIYESMGAPKVEAIILKAIKEKKIEAEDLSLRELWEAFTDNMPVMNRNPDHFKFFPEVGLLGRTKREAIGTGSFEKITGALINAKLIEGYDSIDVIWPNLVTEMKGTLKKETITGITAQVFPVLVGEGEDYKGTGVDEKYVTVKSLKYGRLVEVTEEMVFFDQTGQVLTRANRLGEMCAQHKEKLIVEGAQDVGSNNYYPGDTATAVFRTTSGQANSTSSTPFNAAGLAAIEKLAHQMKDDSLETNYIGVNILGKPGLFPVDLMEEAWELSNNPEHPETAERAKNYWKGKYVPFTSPYVTNQSTTTWYWGDFKRDCAWINIWPLQTFTAKPGNYREFEADIVSRHKVRYYGGFGWLDFRHVFQATA